MKYLAYVALIGATITAPAFAQSNPQPDGTTSAATQLTPHTETGASAAAPWASSPAIGKTRAQVYQELVQAQQDGEMAYIKQLYKGR